MSVDNTDGSSTKPAPPSSSAVPEPDIEIIEEVEDGTKDVNMDLQPSSQLSERNGGLLFDSQEGFLSATLRTPISEQDDAKQVTDVTEEEEIHQNNVDMPYTVQATPDKEVANKAEQAVEDEDTEYDDPWFDAACLTTTDEGGNILPDHLPVPPSSTPGKKKDLERRRSSEIKRSQEGKAIRESYMRSQAAMMPVFEEKEPEKKAEKSLTGSMFAFGNGKAVPPVSEAAKIKATQVLAEDPLDTFGMGPRTTLAGEEDDYFSTGFAAGGSRISGQTVVEPEVSPFPAFAGFQTGKGKKFAEPSEASKARIANLFGEDLEGLPPIDDIFKAPAPGPSKPMITPARPATIGNGFVTPGAKPTIMPSFTAAAISDTPTKSTAFVPPKSVSGMSSFQTASGAKVPALSAEAKAKALALFADEGFGPADLPASNIRTSSFQTAAGAKVPELSAEAKAKALALFADEGFGEADLPTAGSGIGGISTPAPAMRNADGPHENPSFDVPISSSYSQADAITKIEKRDDMLQETPVLPSPRAVPMIAPETPLRHVSRPAEVKQPAELIKDVTNQGSMRTPAPQAKPFRPLLTPLPPTKQDLVNRPPASPLASPRLGIGLGMTPRSRSTLNKRPTFKTPFKPNSSSFSTPTLNRMLSSIRTPGPSLTARPKPASVDIIPVFDMKCRIHLAKSLDICS